MKPPQTLSATKARHWLSEALGQTVPRDWKLCYVKPYIHVLTPEARKRTTGEPMVDRYSVANIYGECEDEIPLSKSPLAKAGK